jgi:hypothetical protein
METEIILDNLLLYQKLNVTMIHDIFEFLVAKFEIYRKKNNLNVQLKNASN